MPDNASLDKAPRSGMKEDFMNPKKPQDPRRIGRKPHVPKQVIPLSKSPFPQLHSQGTRSIDLKDPVSLQDAPNCLSVLNSRANQPHHLIPQPLELALGRRLLACHRSLGVVTAAAAQVLGAGSRTRPKPQGPRPPRLRTSGGSP